MPGTAGNDADGPLRQRPRNQQGQRDAIMLCFCFMASTFAVADASSRHLDRHDRLFMNHDTTAWAQFTKDLKIISGDNLTTIVGQLPY